MFTLYLAHSVLLLKASVAITRCNSFMCVAPQGDRCFWAYVIARRLFSARTNSMNSCSLNWNSNLLCKSIMYCTNLTCIVQRNYNINQHSEFDILPIHNMVSQTSHKSFLMNPKKWKCKIKINKFLYYLLSIIPQGKYVF